MVTRFLQITQGFWKLHGILSRHLYFKFLDTVKHKLQLLHCFFRMKISNNTFLLWKAINSTFDSHKELLQGDKIQQKNAALLHNLLIQNVYIKAYFIFSCWTSFFMEFFNFINSNYCDSFCLKYNPISLMLVTQRGVKSLSEGIKKCISSSFIFVQFTVYVHDNTCSFMQMCNGFDGTVTCRLLLSCRNNQRAWTTVSGMKEPSSCPGEMMLCHAIIHNHKNEDYKMLLISSLILEAFVKASSCLQCSTKYKPTVQ